MFTDITVEELTDRNKERPVVIDVRSPSEYAEATIPGSRNVPIFNDEERAEIGTLYKQVSEQAARDRALEVVSAKLPAFIREIAGISGKKVVFCWRGGMRSRTTATLLSLMNVHVSRLEGGYRAYRQWVVHMLESMTFDPRAVMIHGLTGSGKTALLHRLGQAGYPVIDLEGMAGHRGSVFGEIGMCPSNQKTFDSLLLEDLLRFRQSPYVIMEAESKRIGRIVVPEVLMTKRDEAIHLRVELPIEARVETILEDYRPWEHHEACVAAFRKIASRIHRPIAEEISGALLDGNYDRAVELLLIHYYDPRYIFTEEQYASSDIKQVQAATVDEAACKVQELLSHKFGGQYAE
ncbi:tRNA 2-selenouridine synthase [Paenibacillus antibioticophila]|uniref:tRNA 2-selenouridine synthase n=1 Tax=Paenibacillus antibioticophila TaxID=1274374 RepID=A0A919XUB4_9BACL|nr:tRNA 2-selenouridine(34) synthase MnmH [Paenibacillus antibioticophila]GIO39426.1 tRNA 2-selenouridine synthase [Paenibacillus antibioticophila]